jgi:membrane-associated phospholipid phosphatase
LIIPGTFLLYGGLKPAISGIENLDRRIMDRVIENHPDFVTTLPDYLMWAPSASVYILDAVNAKTAHNFKEHLILDAGSIVITGGLGYAMRQMTKNSETFSKAGTQFPSGHTANAFRGAEILHQELKKSHPVLSYSGYVIASGVGVLRIYDKAHLLSEVIAGAGLGILSTKLTYWIFEKGKRKVTE